jgi:hypothetical protein
MSFPADGGGELLMTYRDPAGTLWSLVEAGGKFAAAGWASARASRRSGGGVR